MVHSRLSTTGEYEDVSFCVPLNDGLELIVEVIHDLIIRVICRSITLKDVHGCSLFGCPERKP